MKFGLSEDTLKKIKTSLKKYPSLKWVKIYGSRAKGNYCLSSDIDLAYSSELDISAELLAELDNLSTPYLFDVTHYETIDNPNLKDHINRVGEKIY